MVDLTHIADLRNAGQHEEARKQLIALVAQFPHDPNLQYQTACIHDFLGLEREAVPFYRAAIEQGLTGEELRGAYLGLGSTYRALGEYSNSSQTLEAGLAHFPEAQELKVFLAMTLYNLGEHHDAVASLLRVLADTTADPEVRGYERAIRFYAENLDQVWEQ